MNILFIDDQEDVQEIMKMVFQEELGAEVYCCSNISEAEDINLLEKNISIIVCDFKLPDKDGLEFYQAVSTSHSHIPFILITGMYFDKDDERMNSFKQGEKSRVLLKPFDEEALIQEIKELV